MCWCLCGVFISQTASQSPLMELRCANGWWVLRYRSSRLPAPDVLEAVDYEATLAEMLADLRARGASL